MLKKYILALIILIIVAYINIDVMVYSYLEGFSLLEGFGLNSVLTYFLLLIFILIIISNEINRHSVKYYIAKTRIIEERGLFSKEMHSLNLSVIDTLKIKRGIIDRILKMGDLEIYVVDSKIIFKDIHNPKALEHYLSEVIDAYKKRHAGFGEIT